MTFIDPSLPSAQREWWDKATKDTLAADHVVENVQEWRKNYVIRREKSVLADELTKKIVNLTPIGCYKSELDTYNYYERIFMHANRSFRSLFEESRNPITRRRQMEIFSIIMACLSCMVCSEEAYFYFTLHLKYPSKPLSISWFFCCIASFLSACLLFIQ